MFSALAEGHGDLKDKINIFIALCPITNLHLASSVVIRYAQRNYGVLKSTIRLLSVNTHKFFMPNLNLLNKMLCLRFPYTCDFVDTWSKPSKNQFNDADVSEA